MGNVIPWSQIHPTIASEEPFLAVIVVDPRRQICVSELVSFDDDAMSNPQLAAQQTVAAAQQAAARVASAYRARRTEDDDATQQPGLRVLRGGAI